MSLAPVVSAALLVNCSRTMPVAMSTLPLITGLSISPLISAEAVTTCAVSSRTAVICRLAGRNGAPGVRKVMAVTAIPALVVRQASRLIGAATPAG
ncbi:hypothetical protein D9M70_480620 [compost metagenome]